MKIYGTLPLLYFYYSQPYSAFFLDPVYTGTDPNGSIPVFVHIGFPFTLDLLNRYRYGSAIRTSLGSLSKGYPFGSVRVEVQCKRLDPIHTGTDRIEDNNISHL